MDKSRKIWLVIAVLACSIIYSFLFPKEKYVSEKILSKLNIPLVISNWYGKDISKDINTQDMRYNFISEVFARTYVSSAREALLFLILDAGNFHNPKVCFGSSGYKIKEISDIKLNYASQKNINAHAIYVDRGTESYLIVYWICINKEISDWNEQKVKELWYSLFNKKKSGLMVRFDIPTKEYNIENAIKSAEKFMLELRKNITEEQAEYLFGK
ncbi:exosortase-associated EpsI family protein [Candidatus Poribacteria bacterium]|nr:exosortase-associated EpsI family protein [Candidatus Poribacteria bacterium]